MTNNNNKMIYIAFGIVLLIAAIPVAVALLGFLGGFFYYLQGAR